MEGMSTVEVSKMVGTSLTMIEKHYGHLVTETAVSDWLRSSCSERILSSYGGKIRYAAVEAKNKRTQLKLRF